jgi:outer membrane biosynthesis protein TonB
VRLAGTAIICILAAFGAAFLVARSVNHQTPARAATPLKTTRVADTITHAAPKVNAELRSQFSPIKGSKLKPKPKPKPKHHKAKPKPPVSVTPSAPSTTQSTPTYTTPTYTAPSYTPPAPTQSSSGSTTHHKKSGGSGGGSGTTTIGGP